MKIQYVIKDDCHDLVVEALDALSDYTNVHTNHMTAWVVTRARLGDVTSLLVVNVAAFHEVETETEELIPESQLFLYMIGNSVSYITYHCENDDTGKMEVVVLP
jgi:hypothetical protein